MTANLAGPPAGRAPRHFLRSIFFALMTAADAGKLGRTFHPSLDILVHVYEVPLGYRPEKGAC